LPCSELRIVALSVSKGTLFASYRQGRGI
jgi:hypothetical protein